MNYITTITTKNQVHKNKKVNIESCSGSVHITATYSQIYIGSIDNDTCTIPIIQSNVAN